MFTDEHGSEKRLSDGETVQKRWQRITFSDLYLSAEICG
jgi:hypothetical protein